MKTKTQVSPKKSPRTLNFERLMREEFAPKTRNQRRNTGDLKTSKQSRSSNLLILDTEEDAE